MKNLYISMFTNDEIYGECVKKLITSLDRFNLKSYIYEIEDRGNWNENTDKKAEIILRAMDDFHDYNIVWIDADAVIESYPTLFDKLDRYDIAYYYSNSKKELRSGTLWIKNNYKMKIFVSSWIKLNKSNDVWEQRNLETIIKNNPVKTFLLPVSYCKIFDNQDDLQESDSVIVHYQASRKTKMLFRERYKIPVVDDIQKIYISGDVKIKIGHK